MPLKPAGRRRGFNEALQPTHPAMSSSSPPQAFIVGGGIAALSTAVLLIRDGGWRGNDIHMIEELPVSGGALDGSGDAQHGFVTRGGRMWTDEAYVCLWDLLDGIPTLDGSGDSVRSQVKRFNDEVRTDAHARLIDREHRILDAARLGFDLHDRAEILRLLVTPERLLGARRIDDCFSAHFFGTHFWAMWRTTFAFQEWHSAVELKRYMLRFLQEFPRIHTLAGVRRTRLNQYESVARPIEHWLRERGVRIEHGARIDDVALAAHQGGQRVAALHGRRHGEPFSLVVGPDDLVFMTLGSMTADSRCGDHEHPAELVRDRRDGAWTLWQNLAAKLPNLGRPEVFCGRVDESKWLSFSITLRNPALVKRIEELSGNAPGTGALMSFKDSAWLMSIVVPHAPHFAGQPEGTWTIWGYGLFVDRPGDYVNKPMAECSGREILTELVRQLNFTDILDQLCQTSTVVPVMMPYITSEFEPRAPGDRPEVLPRGTCNLALLGQYVEIPEDVVFTVEYSVRGAMHAVYGLLGIEREIPPVWHAIADPATAFAALKTLAA